MRKRGCGVLLHITSLPSPYGVGDLGAWAYRFADFLAETKQGFWQILPLNPTDPALGNSPYYSPSAFANNTILLSPDLMIQNGLLKKSDIESIPSLLNERVDYRNTTPYKKSPFIKHTNVSKKTISSSNMKNSAQKIHTGLRIMHSLLY